MQHNLPNTNVMLITSFFLYIIALAGLECLISIFKTNNILIQIIYGTITILLLKTISNFYNKIINDEYEENHTLTIGFIVLYFILIVISFGQMYYHTYLDNEDMFSEPIKDYFDGFYFSLVTITTLGYGDISPKHLYTKILVSIELFVGIWFLVASIPTSISIYANKKALDKHNKKEEESYIEEKRIELVTKINYEYKRISSIESDFISKTYTQVNHMDIINEIYFGSEKESEHLNKILAELFKKLTLHHKKLNDYISTIEVKKYNNKLEIIEEEKNINKEIEILNSLEEQSECMTKDLN